LNSNTFFEKKKSVQKINMGANEQGIPEVSEF
jgi:hypothetical protein